MARRAVIYRGEHAGANMIGYSNTPAVDREFQSYLPSLGYDQEVFGWHGGMQDSRLPNIVRSIGGFSCYYVQITPPISHDDMQAFQNHCDSYGVTLNDGRNRPPNTLSD